MQLRAALASLTGTSYPSEELTECYKKFLLNQFHDILPGTSIPKAYEYAWNDEFIAANNLSEVLKNSVGVLSATMNTQTKGRSVVVYNPVAREREDVVTAELEYETVPASIAVYDNNEKRIPAQIIGKKGNKLKIIFQAKLPSAGMAVFDVRENEETTNLSKLAVTKNTLENEFYKIQVADNGDIASILDKKTGRELCRFLSRISGAIGARQ